MNYSSEARELFLENAVESDRIPMQSYMKNQFQFFGVKSLARRNIFNLLWKEWKKLDREEILGIVDSFWYEPEREFQYLGMDFLKKIKSKLSDSHLPQLEKWIQFRSWWDTVDFLAAHPVGEVLRNRPELQSIMVDKWLNSSDRWLWRTALLYQLRYKDSTDFPLLSRVIIQLKNESDFFIRKGAGWALREYSKTNRAAVANFLQKNPDLAYLTIREASKYL